MRPDKNHSLVKLKAILSLCGILLGNLIFAQTYQVGHMSINFKDPSRTGGYVIAGGINMTGSGRDVGTEVYYPATAAGNNQPVAAGQFPIVVIGHGFVMTWDSYDNIYNQLASSGYIVLLPRTEGGFSPSHSEFGKDLKFLVNAGQSLNTVTSPASLLTFNGKVLPKSAIGGHSMGGGSSFLAAANNSSIECIFTFAPATTNPSSVDSAALVNVPSLIISGALDCVADTTVQNSHYAGLSSTTKFHIILDQLTHCDFGNGTNFNCTFGQNSSGCSNVLSNAQAFPRYMDYVQNFLDRLLKNDCVAGQTFMDSVNTPSSFRLGLKTTGTIACVNAVQNLSDNGTPLRIYPNPTNGIVVIEGFPIKGQTVEVFNSLGLLIYQAEMKEEKNVVDLSDKAEGVYLIRTGNTFMKIIKE